MISKRDFNYIFFSIWAILMLMLVGCDNTVLIAAVFVFTTLMLYILRNLYNHIFLFCFLICFFTFLLSGQVLNRIMYVYQYNFSDEIELHADICLLISLLSLATGYFIAGKVTYKKNTQNEISNLTFDYNNKKYRDIRRISKCMYFACYAFWMLTLLDVVLYVAQNGYANYYLAYSNRVPSVLRQIGYMAPTSLFIFLATMPGKKEARLPLLLYVLYAVTSLGTGRRVNFMTSLLIVFGYMLCRNVTNPDRDKPWLSKKKIITLVLAIPFFLMAMYFYEYIRSTSVVGSASDYSPLLGFFVRQGTSINVIKYGQQFSSMLNEKAYYSLFNTIQWIQNSVLNSIFEFDFAFGKQSVETAKMGTYLADFVSYNANASIYTAGMGYGSCYIEELFIDFGYIGVVFGNLLYGILFKILEKGIRIENHVWRVALGLFILDLLFKAPRATFDAFFGKMLYFEVWGAFIIVYVLAYFESARRTQ